MLDYFYPVMSDFWGSLLTHFFFKANDHVMSPKWALSMHLGQS
jgi:hypothetical protein